MPRIAGYIFNPVSFYFIYDENFIFSDCALKYDFDRIKKQCWWSAHLGDNIKKLKINTFNLWCQIEEEVIKISKKLNCKSITIILKLNLM